MPIAADRTSSGSDALAELVTILRAAALGGIPGRDGASRYMQHRETLLHDFAREALPGFLIQCNSIYKFAEFIGLYHPSTAARLAFLDSAFESCRSLPGSGAGYDVFDNPEF